MRAASIVLRVSLGLAVGLILAELAFRARDEGAFPHVHFYQPDPVLGTRLEPHATQRISFSGNPVTSLRTNALGFRGAEWAAPAAGVREVLVVGDSQVFGLGVEEGETFSAALAEKLGRPVLNAGVPTYGPGEYLEVARRVLTERKSVDTLVLTLNMANDLFEASRPNRDRHAVWDGWAVRSETAPREPPLTFPLRGWLMSESHLVFAIRSLLHARRGAEEPALGFPSEGGFDVLVSEAKVVDRRRSEEEALAQAAVGRLETRARAAAHLAEVNEEIFVHVVEHRDEGTLAAVKALARFEGDPRDIMESRFAESARRIDITGQALLEAALSLRKNERVLTEVPALAQDRDLKRALAARKTAEEALAEAEEKIAMTFTSSAASPLGAVIAEAKELTDAHGAQLVVLVLPLDVQVSSEQWKKYGLPVTDLTATRALNADAVDQAALVGARAVDALPTLALTPDAFLHGDLHMTARGHRAVAGAIADVMSRPPAPPKPRGALALPAGRSFVPSHESWRLAPEVTVRGSSKARCETKIIREWFRMVCLGSADHRPVGIEVTRGGGGEALVFKTFAHAYLSGREPLEHVGLLVPLVDGEPVEAEVRWATHTQRLTLVSATDMAFGERNAARNPIEPLRTLPEIDLGSDAAYGLDPHCDGPRDACAIDSNRAATGCKDGFMRFGALGRCVPACDAAGGPCAEGLRCRTWQGRQGCTP